VLNTAKEAAMADPSNRDFANKTALVLGATGGVGGALTEVLLRRGWTIQALTRDPARAAAGRDPAIQWICGDAMDRAAVTAAAAGVSLLVHAVNPPGYRDWDKLVLPMMDNTIAAARAAGARVLLPGTVYNYGPDAFPVLREDSPQQPLTRKGKIRAEMERRLRRSGVPALVVRAGDFFGGPQGGNNWFSLGLVKAGAALKRVNRPGRRGVGHAWAYLPDLAETMAELVEKTPAEGFELYHFAGHYDADGEQMFGAIGRAAGRRLKVQPLPWLVFDLLSPFVVTFREMREMRYLWRTPLKLDNARLLAVLGREPHTPLDEAVKKTLRELKCV
jgi:nucleoside-diphosphate-sugar epimerase